MTQYQYPFPLDTITTDFGAVDSAHPNPHRGTDFAPGGLDIPAVSDGVVVRDERQTGLGNVVTVRADDGIFWACSHMADRTPFSVGERVSRGDTVGVVGNTGSLTTGRHLHFTMSPSSDNPATGVVFDPIPYITARLTSSAGGGTTPFPSDQIIQEDDDMCNPKVAKRTEGSPEWAIVSPLIAGRDAKGNITTKGYRVTTDPVTAAAWCRLYGRGQGLPTTEVDRAGYLKIQAEAGVLFDEWAANSK